MWVCLHCGATCEEDDWESCWKCSRPRDAAAPGYDEAQHQLSEIRRKLSLCQRCDSGRMKYVGIREIPFDLHGSDHVSYSSEKYVLYACNRCGKVELFLPKVGDELRGDP